MNDMTPLAPTAAQPLPGHNAGETDPAILAATARREAAERIGTVLSGFGSDAVLAAAPASTVEIIAVDVIEGGGVGHELLKLMTRRDELAAAFQRMPAVTDEPMKRRAADFAAQIAAADRAAKAEHTKVKEPWLRGGRAVDAAFNDVSAALTTLKKDVLDRIGAYDREQNRIAREARAAEAKKKADEEQAARDAAAALQAVAQSPADQAAAAEQQRIADQAAAERAALTAVPVAQPVTTRGDFGSVTSSTRFVHDPDSIDRAKLDLEVLRPYLPMPALEQAIRAAIKAGIKTIAGVTIAPEARYATRS